MMRFAKIRRVAALRKGARLPANDPNRRIWLDFAQEELWLNNEGQMFEYVQIGSVVVVDTFSFPFVGRLIHHDDVSLTLEDAVRILYDGRHHLYAQGADKVPKTGDKAAEIEKTHSPWTIPLDAILGLGPYAGGKIPPTQ
jgi:hypothetical protein